MEKEYDDYEEFKTNIGLLDNSILHWKENVKPITRIDINWRSCACCTYKDNYLLYNCSPCPIFITTKKSLCFGTNYYNVCIASNKTKKSEANHMLSELYEIRRQYIANYYKDGEELKMTKDQLNHHLTEFLKRNRCLGKFKKNVKNRSKNIEELLNYNLYYPQRLFHEAFSWIFTEQGHDFWSDISYKWRDYIDEIL